MKNSKKSWALKPKHKRNDNFNWKFMTAYDWFYYGLGEVKEDHNQKRMRNRIACKKMQIGFSEDEVYVPNNKLVSAPRYY